MTRLSSKISSFLILLFISSGISGQDKKLENKDSFLSSSQAKEKSADALIREGVYSGKKQLYEESEGKFIQASRIIDEQSAIAYHNLAYTYEMMGKLPEAVVAYKQSVDRNPHFILSRQNLGRLLYQTGDYEEAIIEGEKVLEQDRFNADVPRWLPDAYRKASEERILELQTRKDKGGKYPDDSDTGHCAQKKNIYNTEIGYNFHETLAIYKSGKLANYMVDSSLVKIPMDFYVLFQPGDEFNIFMSVGTPDFGLLNPSILYGQEEFNLTYNHKDNYYGFGVLFTQADLGADATPRYNTFISNRDYDKVTDTKFGFLIGSRSVIGDFSLKVYSKYLFRDKSSGPQKNEIDRSLFELEYRTSAKLWKKQKAIPGANEKPFEVLLSITANELFITEYEVTAGTNLGHYLGYYDFALGLEYGKLRPSIRPVVTFGGYLKERLYMIDLNDTSPTAFGNGQGFFGLDIAKATKGNAFSGYRSNSHIGAFFSRQMFKNRLIFKEEIGVEYAANAEDRHGVFIKGTVAFRF